MHQGPITLAKDRGSFFQETLEIKSERMLKKRRIDFKDKMFRD